MSDFPMMTTAKEATTILQSAFKEIIHDIDTKIIDAAENRNSITYTLNEKHIFFKKIWATLEQHGYTVSETAPGTLRITWKVD